MAGLDPAIQSRRHGWLDARIKPAHEVLISWKTKAATTHWSAHLTGKAHELPREFRKQDAQDRADMLRILIRRDKLLARRIASIQRMQDLSSADLERIVEVLTDEFSEKGLGRDYEPTQYGLRVEDLIDYIGQVVVDRANTR